MRVDLVRPSRRVSAVLAGLCMVGTLVIAGCGPAPVHRKLPMRIPEIRVAIITDAHRVEIRGGDVTVRDRDSGRSSALGQGERLAVSLSDAGPRPQLALSNGENALSNCRGPLDIGSAGESSEILVEGKPYPGRIEIRATSDGKLCVINHVPLERYLVGVMMLEMGDRGEADMEAMKAQAVAARTYVLTRLDYHQEEGFDVYGDIRDQAYVGRDPGWNSNAWRAVRATEGLAVTYRGRLVDAYYSSTCGGHTANVSDVWNKPSAHYLQGAADRRSARGSDYCGISPVHSWHVEWSRDELQRVLERTLPQEVGLSGGVAIGEVMDVKIKGRFRCGRVDALEIRTKKGKYRVKGDRVRWVLRPPGGDQILRSTLFDISVERKRGRIVSVSVDGRGNGHGVGMCQWGAIGMAREGKGFREILSHYYTGTRVQAIGSSQF